MFLTRETVVNDETNDSILYLNRGKLCLLDGYPATFVKNEGRTTCPTFMHSIQSLHTFDSAFDCPCFIGNGNEHQ